MILWQLFENASYTPRLIAKSHICVLCDIFNTKVISTLALIKKQGLTSTALSIQIVPFGFEQLDHLQIQELPGDHKLHPLIDYLSCIIYKVSGMVGWREVKSSLLSDQISSVK